MFEGVEWIQVKFTNHHLKVMPERRKVWIWSLDPKVLEVSREFNTDEEVENFLGEWTDQHYPEA